MAEQKNSMPPRRPGGPGHGPRSHGYQRPQDLRGTVKKLLHYVGRYKGLLVLVAVCLLLSSVGSVASSYFLKPAINDYILPGDFAGLLRLLVLMGLVFVLSALCSYVYSRIMVRVSQRTVAALRQDLFDKLQELPLRYFDTHQSGDLMSRFTNDIDTVSEMINNSFANVLSNSLTFLCTIGMLLYLNWALTLITFAFLGLMLLVVKVIGGRSRVSFQRQQAALGDLNGYIEEMIEGQKVIKVFHHEQQAIDQFTQAQPEADLAGLLAREDFPTQQLLSRPIGTIYSVWYIPQIIQKSLNVLIALNPKDEYPEARALSRHFILHLGGTNTGKTYAGFQRLKQARTGVYLAPLRLLALEAQEALLDAGVDCSLTTGEEEDRREEDTHVAATAEKLNLKARYDVAVIDECQMIADPHRGYAWTRAILGVQAPEVHLCAAPEAEHLLRRIIDSYRTAPGCGLPIGNLTSQHFANYYMAYADHHVREALHAPAYVRYMDDMVLWHDDKTELLRITAGLTSFIGERLRLTLKPPCINNTDKGVPFLGYVLFPGRVRLNRNSKKRFRCKMNSYDIKLDTGEWSQARYALHVQPLVAFTRFADAREFRQISAKKREVG